MIRKVFEIKDVISWSNSEDAKKYVEKQGYLGDSVQDLITKVNNDDISTLWNVYHANEVNCIFEDVYDNKYGLFLPIDKVREVDIDEIKIQKI